VAKFRGRGQFETYLEELGSGKPQQKAADRGESIAPGRS
jgi:hypothetical protein